MTQLDSDSFEQVEIWSLMGQARGTNPEGRLPRHALRRMGVTAATGSNRIGATTIQLSIYRAQPEWESYPWES